MLAATNDIDPLVSPKNPEVDLMLTCSRVRLDMEAETRIRVLLSGPVRWDILLAIADHNALTPLLYYHLHHLDDGLIPDRVMAKLRQTYRVIAFQSISLATELKKLARLYTDAGIQFLPLKGPILAMQAYGSLTLRQYGDVDILVRPSDVPSARAVLISAGYESLNKLSERQEALVIRADNELSFYCVDRRVRTELHWSLVSRYLCCPLDNGDIWSRLESFDLEGTLLSCMPFEDLVIYLCFHGMSHCWDRLEWICCLAELLRVQKVDWEQLIAIAHKGRCVRVVNVGLYLAYNLADAPIPYEIASRLDSDPTVVRLGNWAVSRLFDPVYREPRFRDIVGYQLLVKEGWSDRMVFCIRRIFTLKLDDIERYRLPTWLFPAYHALRAIRLLWCHTIRPILRVGNATRKHHRAVS